MSVLGLMHAVAGRCGGQPAPAAPPPSVPPTLAGPWMDNQRAEAFDVRPCAPPEGPADTFCVIQIWSRTGLAGRDAKNPDPARRTRPLCGLPLVTGARPAAPNAPGTWAGARVYDPGSGKSYNADLRSAGDGRLELRVRAGVFRHTERWHREAPASRCRPAA